MKIRLDFVCVSSDIIKYQLQRPVPKVSFGNGMVIIVTEFNCDNNPVVSWTRNGKRFVPKGLYRMVITHNGNHYTVRMTISDLKSEQPGTFVAHVRSSHTTFTFQFVLTLTGKNSL